MPTEDLTNRQELLMAIDGWYLGTLTESEATWLKDRLRTDEQACCMFIEYGDMLASLSFAGDNDDEQEWPVDALLARALRAEERALSRSGRRITVAGIVVTAVAVLIMTVGMIWVTRRNELEELANAPAQPAPLIEIPATAVISDLYVPPYLNSPINIKRNLSTIVVPGIGMKLLAKDELVLVDQQLVEMTFTSGAQLVLQGPANLVVNTPLSAQLKRGRALGSVPPPAVGFSLEIPSGLVRDLGTEFAVDANQGRTDVSVLNGIVDCELNAQANQSKATRLERGEGVRMDPQSGTLSPLAHRPESLDRIVDFHVGVANVAGEARFVQGDIPLPSEAANFPSPLAQIYLERQNIFIKRSENQNEFWFTSPDGNPGVNPPFVAKIVREPSPVQADAVLLVDAYFIRVRAPDKKTLVVTGSVTFRQEIVAALTATAVLESTDEILARPEFVQDWKAHPNRARGSDEGADRVEISPDGKTLTFTLQASGASDEMRVLVRHRGTRN